MVSTKIKWTTHFYEEIETDTEWHIKYVRIRFKLKPELYFVNKNEKKKKMENE